MIERVKAELKQILKKDFNKKMIESTAFKSFEVWWDEQSRKIRQPKPKEEAGQPLQVQTTLVSITFGVEAPSCNWQKFQPYVR